MHVIKSLATLRSGTKVSGEKLVIDAQASRRCNQKMRKPDKAALGKFLKAFVEPVEQPLCPSLVIDGGWLLHNVKWEANLTWNDIAHNYLRFVKAMGSQHLRITVVFDGYVNSTKDHDHFRRTKHACCDIQIRPDIQKIIPREKFLDDNNNKDSNGIRVQQCSDDADTSIVQAALNEESPLLR